MTLPIPWNHIESSLQNLQDFDLGAQKLADFFKGKEDKQSPDELLQIFFRSNPQQKMVERLLFFLLDIGVPDRQIGSRALQTQRLKRLWARYKLGSSLTEFETGLVERTAWLFDQGKQKVEEDLIGLRTCFLRLIDGESISDDEHTRLFDLIESEAEALRDRVNWLSENTDPYNMATMARILPRLRIYDEAVHEGMDLAKRQKNREPVGLKILSFEAHMGGPTFEKWLGKISESESLTKLGAIIMTQREKKVPTLDLVSLTSVCRWTWEVVHKKVVPIDWIEKALASYQGGSFSVDVGESTRILLPALSGSGADLKNNHVSGNFGLKSFPSWIGRDLLTKSYLKATDEGALDMKAVITQNITRDSILEALLTNPKVYQTPGLVGFIAATSRSLALLSRIAKSQSMLSGFANRDVPLALLQSPCNIPISLLRPLINVRNVPLIELKHLARAKAGVRREVIAECEAYLKSRA